MPITQLHRRQAIPGRRWHHRPDHLGTEHQPFCSWTHARVRCGWGKRLAARLSSFQWPRPKPAPNTAAITVLGADRRKHQDAQSSSTGSDEWNKSRSDLLLICFFYLLRFYISIFTISADDFESGKHIWSNQLSCDFCAFKVFSFP
jgi:hypothetical protein